MNYGLSAYFMGVSKCIVGETLEFDEASFFWRGWGGARENFKVVRVWRKIKWRQNSANYKIKKEEHEGLQAHYTAMQSSRWGLDTGVL